MKKHEIKKKGPKKIDKPEIKAESLINTQNTQHNIKREGLGPSAGHNQQN